MASGDAQLDAMIARIRELPELTERAAPDAADAVREELERSIAAGTDPDGKPWQVTLEGEQPLQTAKQALTVVVVGRTRVFVRVTGHIARHHLGRAKGGVYRRVIPTVGIPPKIRDAIKRVLTSHFERTMKGPV